MNIRALVAEFVGTFILIIFGSLGVATVSVLTEGQGNVPFATQIIPFAFGLGLLAAIAIAGHASGGHFNPAVTLAAVLDGRLPWKDGIGYGIAQLLGGLTASLGILFVFSAAVVSSTVNVPGTGGVDAFAEQLNAFAIETVLTAVFVAVILSVTVRAPGQAILVIPLTLVAIHFVAMHMSGASVNPVRSLAPALVSGTYDALWVYLAGPFLGAVLGWGVYRYLTLPDDELEVEADDDYLDELEEDDDATA